MNNDKPNTAPATVNVEIEPSATANSSWEGGLNDESHNVSPETGLKYPHKLFDLCLPQKNGSRVSVSYGEKMKQSHRHFALRTSTRLLLSSIAAVTFSAPIHADETLDNITVTANRMPTVNVLAPTTVITRADIERLQITDLTTLLSRQPGIDIAVNGGLGKTSSIFMRGTNSGHVLVLVDGVKWSSATAGSSAIQHFPVEQIERIEIVSGPRSGLYGSEAIGGVIHIFTRKGEAGSVTPFAKLSYGTHDSKQVAAGVSGGSEKTTYNLSFDHLSTDGINAQVGQDPDKDGYRRNSVSAKVNHQFTNKLNIGANFLRSEGFNEYDSNLDILKGDSVQQIIGTNAALQVNDAWLVSLLLSESRDKSTNYRDSVDDGTFDTRHRLASLTNTLEVTPNHTLNLGLEYEVDDINSSVDYNETSRDNKAVFVSWQGSAEKNSWLLSARHDDNEAYGSYNTGTAEWGYWLQDGLQLTANVGTAFNAPSFNQLYYPNYGVATLRPEKSENFGVGLQGNQLDVTWSINAYHNRIKDLIGGFPVDNVDKAVIKGIEFVASTSMVGWDVAFNASLLKPEDESTGNILQRRAQRLANVHFDKQWGAWSTGASWKLSDHRFDDAANNTRLGGYGLLDLRVAYQLDTDWSLQANVTNVFNKEYQTARDFNGNNYNSLDRIAMFSVVYQP